MRERFFPSATVPFRATLLDDAVVVQRVRRGRKYVAFWSDVTLHKRCGTVRLASSVFSVRTALRR